MPKRLQSFWLPFAAARNILTLLGLISVLPSQAIALSARVWVSGHGVDQAGCGPVASPCRTMQFAHDNAAPGGEIDVLDPAGFGAIAISKSISIVNDGVGVAGLFSTATNPAVYIESTEFVSVLLRGLTIDGAGQRFSSVAFVGTGSLSVQNCLVKHSEGLFVLAHAPSSVQVLNSTFTDNGQSIAVVPTGDSQNTNPVSVVIDRTSITGNGKGLHGIYLWKDGSSQVSFLISNSTVTSNINGMTLGPGVEGVVRATAITSNIVGISSLWQSPVALTGNTISGNSKTGVETSYGTKSFGDNQITGNGVDVDGTLTPIATR